MREHPAIFDGTSVRQILAGIKTQSRRVMKRFDEDPDRARLLHMDPIHGVATFSDSIPDDPVPVEIPCPYGAEGDQLWVREQFAAALYSSTPYQPQWVYGPLVRGEHSLRFHYRADLGPEIVSWRSPMFMYRWASRIDLELVHIRAERLQDITTDDIRAEGIDDGSTNPTMGARHDNAMRMAWEKRWDEKNGARNKGVWAWARNPWIWRLEFCLLDDDAAEDWKAWRKRIVRETKGRGPGEFTERWVEDMRKNGPPPKMRDT